MTATSSGLSVPPPDAPSLHGPDSARGGEPESAVTPAPPPGRRDLQGPCIEWKGSRDGCGYGRRWVDGKNRSAHRVAWEEARGSIPDGLHVLHHCDNPPCYNVDHLFLGTHLDNMHDMAAKGRAARRGGPRAFGEANPAAKLTSAQVAEIRACYGAGGISQEALARLYGVAPSHIHRIVHFHNWKSAVEVDAAAATSASTTPFTDFHPTASALPEQDDER